MLKIGDKAPQVGIEDQNNKIVSLNEFKNKWVILYFYPKDNTPGCTIEAKSFTCLAEDFAKLNAVVIGVSKDSVKSHNNFISKQELNIRLLSDPDHKVLESYGAWQLKNMYGREFMGVIRSTFIIDPKGNIAETWYKVRAKGHAEKVLNRLKELVRN